MIGNDNDFGPDAPGQPPWERMMQGERAFAALQDPASWLAAQNALSGLLAQAAAAVARADALFAADRDGGLAERMAVEGAAAIAWHALSRIAPDALALYLHGAAPAPADDLAARDLFLAGAMARHLRGPPPKPGEPLPGGVTAHVDRAVLDDLREKGRGLDPLVRAGFVFQGLYNWTAEAPSGPAEAAFGAMRHVHGAAFRALPFLPVALAPAGRWALPSGTVPDRLATWLRALTAGAEAMALEARMLDAWQDRAARVGARKGRALKAATTALTEHPLVSVPLLCSPRYGLSPRGARAALHRLAAAGLVAEITGRGRFRLYRIAQGQVPGV
jgi:hypothetical protein